MKHYSFSIRGNHESDTANPIPKIRKTMRQRWTPEARRYAAWKTYVQEAFLRSLMQLDFNRHIHYRRVLQKPIKLDYGDKAVMDIRIFWKDERHGDPENVFGSIADALFYNDKCLDGSFQSEISSDKQGRVEVAIKIKKHGEKETDDTDSLGEDR